MTNFFKHKTAIVDNGAQIGPGSRVWHFTHICGGAQIGAGVSLGQNVFVGNKVIIGDHCKVQNNVSIYDNVILKEGVFCGPSMVFTNVILPRSEFPVDNPNSYKKTKVKYSASIGANATILCGIKIGKYAMIGAGAVVLINVPDYGLVVGNPGKLIGWVDIKGNRLNFKKNGVSACGNYKYDGKIVKLLDFT